MSRFTKTEQFERRRHRVRAKISGTGARPRVSFFKSRKHIYAQMIDDAAGKTLVASSDGALAKATQSGSRVAFRELSVLVGKDLAAKAARKGIQTVVFDKSGYAFRGHIASFAQALRESGIVF